jgi:hypothetical protein
VIVLLNGPFGGGKTSTAEELVGLVPGSRLFDPETVGFMLRELLPDHPGDFQDLPPWRTLFAATAAEVAAFTGQVLVAPMSILDEDYAEEVTGGLRDRGLKVCHVLLRTDRATLESRIAGHELFPGDRERSADAAAFRRSRAEAFFTAAGGWLGDTADVTVDTTDTPPAGAAAEVAAYLAR